MLKKYSIYTLVCSPTHSGDFRSKIPCFSLKNAVICSFWLNVKVQPPNEPPNLFYRRKLSPERLTDRKNGDKIKEQQRGVTVQRSARVTKNNRRDCHIKGGYFFMIM